MCDELIERARAKLTTARRICSALHIALCSVGDDAAAQEQINALIHDARLREKSLAQIVQGLEAGKYAHVDDIIMSFEGQGWILEKRCHAPWTCDLCDHECMRYTLRSDTHERRVVVGCTNCGFGFETDYIP